MIPTAILAGLVLGAWLRWWAVPVTALLWGVVVAFIDPGAIIGGVLLGAVNALVGVLIVLGLRRLASRAQTFF